MDKLNMHSADKVGAHIAQIGALFPHCVTEVVEDGRPRPAIDFDLLRQELSDVVVEGPQERYQITWPDKRKSILLANAPIAKTLRPCREQSECFYNTENLYIRGDNLDALKLLQETYLGKVKVICIDPPYNTGKDFLYPDYFAQSKEEYLKQSCDFDDDGNLLARNPETYGRFHTKWLNSVYPRLRLARDLLEETGVILINIDENEMANLQKICDELFGEQNDLGTIVWDKRNPKGDARGISCQHEYILAYAKNLEALAGRTPVRRPKKNAAAMLKKARELFARCSPDYTLEDANRDFALWVKEQPGLSGGERAYNRIDENGEVFRPVSMAWPNKKGAPEAYFQPLLHPVTKKPCPVPERGWRNPPATMRELARKGEILFGRDESTQPTRKYLLRENMMEKIPSLLYYGGSDTELLASMGIPFMTPKVVSVVKEHIRAFSNPDSIILDFFAGSGTTAHAVMELNAEDGGRRKFILVQYPEKLGLKEAARKAGFEDIFEIGRQRLLRAAEKIRREHPGAPFDGGFRVLRVDSTNMRDVYYSPAELDPKRLQELSDNLKPDRTDEDLLFQVLLEFGVPLSSKLRTRTIAGKRVFDVSDGLLLACFDAGVTEETVTGIAKSRPRYFVMRDASLASDSVAANFEQIFAVYSPATVRKVL